MTDPRRYLVIPAVAAFGVDVVLTLMGQPLTYWQGEYSVANEGAPVGLLLLRFHPLAFAGAATLYAIAFSLAIRFLTKPIAVWLSFGFFIAHTSGINSWLYGFRYWEPLHNCVAAAVASYCYAMFFRLQSQRMIDS